uniref:Uncharacterized protein n=1 Tax=Schlesneria paludicola TaxID=360056 RepID=A0A7C2K339_9PLAN
MSESNHDPTTDVLPITEHIADWRGPELRVDFAQRLVTDVVLSGPVSRNGHRYTEEALQQAAPLYDHKPVFLDHAPNLARPFERSMRDLVGTVLNPRYEGGRIRGDIQVLDTEAGRTFLALVDSGNPAVGMSHVVLAQRGRDPQVVERIHDVVSVDAVVFPATTQGLRETAEFRDLEQRCLSLEAETRRLSAALQQREHRQPTSRSRAAAPASFDQRFIAAVRGRPVNVLGGWS